MLIKISGFDEEKYYFGKHLRISQHDRCICGRLLFPYICGQLTCKKYFDLQSHCNNVECADTILNCPHMHISPLLNLTTIKILTLLF